MMKNQQEWVKNITPTGMKVKVKRLTGYLSNAMRASAGEKMRFHLLNFASLIPFVFGIGVAGCGMEPHKGSITNEKLVAIYVDLLDTRKTPISKGVDSTLASDSVLMKYGMNRQEFLEAVHTRSAHPESWKTFYEEVVRKLEERQQGTDKKMDSLRATIGARPEPSSK